MYIYIHHPLAFLLFLLYSLWNKKRLVSVICLLFFVFWAKNDAMKYLICYDCTLEVALWFALDIKWSTSHAYTRTQAWDDRRTTWWINQIVHGRNRHTYTIYRNTQCRIRITNTITRYESVLDGRRCSFDNAIFSLQIMLVSWFLCLSISLFL